MKQTFPPELAGRLRRLVTRVRLLLLARGLLAVLAVTTVAVLAVMAIDAAVVLAYPAARWVFSLSGLTLVAATAWSMLILPLLRPLTLTRMARVLETRHPAMQERISTALELASYGGAAGERASAELIALLTRDAGSDLSGVSPRQEFSVRSIKPFLRLTALALFLLGVIFAVWPQQCWLLMLRALAPHREFDTLQALSMQIKPGDVMLLTGSPLLFEAKVSARHGLRAEIIFQRQDTGRVVERMKRLSKSGAEEVTYELELPAVDKSFSYRVRYGKAVTRPYHVTTVTEPKVVEARVALTYPAYTGLAATQTVGNVDGILAIAGTRMRLEARFDRACASSLLVNDLAFPAGGRHAGSASWQQTLTAKRTGRWTIALCDRNGFTNSLTWAAMTVLPDRPPQVKLDRPANDQLKLRPSETLVCSGRAMDDYGFSALQMVLKISKDKEIVLPVTVTPAASRQCEMVGTPDLQDLYDRDIRSFTLMFRVKDNLPPELGGPNVRESRGIKIQLVTVAAALREQERELAKKELAKQLKEAARELNEAADDVAREKASFDQPEMTKQAEQKLEEAREAALKADELLLDAAAKSEDTPFEAFAQQILETRDEKVEPAFEKLDKIPLAAPEARKAAGEEAERALREAASKVNELVDKALNEADKEQQALSRLADAAQREQALAQEATDGQMERQEMQEWANQQNAVEQMMQQQKPPMEDAAFNAATEDIRQARDAMQLAQRAQTPEQDQALKSQNAAQEQAASAAELAEKAAEQALDAANTAETLAENMAATEELLQAAEQAAEAAEAVHEAAEAAEAAAQAAQAAQAEQVAEWAQEAAEEAQATQAAAEAAQAEQAAEAAEAAQQAAEAEQATQAAEQGAAEAEQAAQQAAEVAQEAYEDAAEAAEAAQQTSESAEAAQAEQAAEAAQAAQQAAEAAQQAAEAAEAAQAAEQGAAEAAQQAAEGAQEAQEAQFDAAEAADAAQAAAEAAEAAQQAADAAEAAQAAAEADLQAATEAMSDGEAQQTNQGTEQSGAEQSESLEATASELALDAVELAQAAAEDAQAAMQSAAEAAESAQAADPTAQGLAEQLAEAAALTDTAGELAEQAAERLAQADMQDMGMQQKQAETGMALEEARQAMLLAEEAAGMMQQSAETAVSRTEQMQQAAANAMNEAASLANEAAQAAEQAENMSEAAANPELQDAAQQGSEAAELSSEAVSEVGQALETMEQGGPEAAERAMAQAREGQAKAQQAQALAQQAAQLAQSQTGSPNTLQRAAAEKAQQAAASLSKALDEHMQRQEEAWEKAQKRLEQATRYDSVGKIPAPADQARDLHLTQDWVRFKGEVGAAAYEEMLKKTPVEYRELVKRYFEEVAREGAEVN